MPESIVDVDLADLKRLVEELIRSEVESGCHRAAEISLPSPTRAGLVGPYNLAKPQQEKTVRLRYRELLDALEIGKDIRSELSKFARLEGWRK